jgi:phthalate 4,5-dioxygenase
MLSRGDSDALTKVGPGTPMGELMRRYWQPIALSTQLEADGAPLRAPLLGERFVVFRDSSGRVGVLDELCMHRGVSLALGRNEEGGLRCLFHGWKYAVDGTVLETPNVCGVKAGLKAPAYPVYEEAGIVWTYIGPRDQAPPRRSFAHEAVPADHLVVIRTNVNASWLPLMEGGLDSSHVPILHTNQVRPAWGAAARGERPPPQAGGLLSDDLVPEIKVAKTPFGFHYCALRRLPGGSGELNGRLVPAVLPNIRLIPFGDAVVGAIEVPIDDGHTSTYTIIYSEKNRVDRQKQLQTFGFVPPFYDEKTCNLNLDWRDGLGQDRSIMKENWTGYRGIELEDYAVTVSMGSDWDRSKEHLVKSDAAIVCWRRVLLENLERISKGQAPQAVDFQDLSRIGTYDRTLAAKDGWQSYAPDYRQMFR